MLFVDSLPTAELHRWSANTSKTTCVGLSALSVSSRLIELQSHRMRHKTDERTILFSVYFSCMHSLFAVHATGEQDVDKEKDGVRVRDQLVVHR